MTKEQLIALLNDMSLEEKVNQMSQVIGGFFDDDTVITGPMAEMGFTEENIELSGSVIGSMGAETVKKIQKSYMTAKARVQEVESQQEAIEKKYIADNGIVNPDGSVPEFLYCMDDDAAFEKANDECAALIAAAGLEAALLSARSDLKTAEDRLISYGLSLAPAGVRATLEGAVQRNAATRAKVLDLAFRLDVSTVRA